MTVILHLLDRTCDETQLQVLDVLRRRPGDAGHEHRICAVDVQALRRVRGHWGQAPLRADRRLHPAMHWSPRLAKVAEDVKARLVHAWGLEAAALAASRVPQLPLALTVLDPLQVDAAFGRRLRALPGCIAVAAGSQVIRRMLIACGLAPERIAVIRGPVDFAALNAARKLDLRKTIAGDADPVLLLPGPPARGDGHQDGLWAGTFLSQFFPKARLLMPCDSQESRRLVRFMRRYPVPDLLVVPPPSCTWAQLVTCADLLFVPAAGEICTEPIAWAMAAGLPVVATAVRSVAELIADRQNGFLCKPGDFRLQVTRIREALADSELRRRVTDAARGQAYEVFGVRDFTDNYSRLYNNLLDRQPVAQDIRDTAMVA